MKFTAKSLLTDLPNDVLQFARAYAVRAQSIVGSATPKQKATAAVFGFFTLGAATAFSLAPSIEVPKDQVTESISVSLAQSNTNVRAVISRAERMQRGDSIVSMLARAGVKDPAIHTFLKTDPQAKLLARPKTGQLFAIEMGDDGRLLRLSSLVESSKLNAAKSSKAQSIKAQSIDSDIVELPKAQAHRLVIQRELTADASSDKKSATVFSSNLATVQLIRSVEVRQAFIKGSLFGATDAAGIPDSVVYQLGEIFESEFDFDQDVRKGDSLRLVYETLRVEDGLEAPLPGRVLAAEYTSKKLSLNALWFERENGRGEYFTNNGKALKKSFLRSPLEFTRISSGFTESRQHPVFRDWRAHKGVDYAAPSGTKVRTIGDGVVDFVGVQRGYGNVVSIKHNDKHSTLYAHLSEFSKDLKVGKKLLQGDVIGAVGQTGWATGPHLHFEFRIENQPADPLNIALAPAKPLQGVELKRFGETAGQLRAHLNLAASIRSARFE